MNKLYGKIEEIEKEILRISITRAKNLEELAGLYRRVNNIRKEFLECSFSKYSLGELEQLRFTIQEQLLNLKIMIKEYLNKDASGNVEDMHKLWSLNESS